MNQLGEAAGVTCFLALDQQRPVEDVDYKDVRKELAKDGFFYKMISFINFSGKGV